MGDPPTSVSRCHGDVTGRRTARTGRTRRTARLVSLSESAMIEITSNKHKTDCFYFHFLMLREYFSSNSGSDRRAEVNDSTRPALSRIRRTQIPSFLHFMGIHPF